MTSGTDAAPAGRVRADAAPARAAGRRWRVAGRWALDVLVVVAAVVAGRVALGQDLQSRSFAPAVAPLPDWLVSLGPALGALACLALLGRRRWPVGTAVGLAVVGAVLETVTGAVLVAVFTVAVRRRWPQVLAVVAVAMASATALYVLRLGPDMPFAEFLVLRVLLLTAPVAWGASVRARQQLTASLRERAVRAETEQRLRVEQAQALERTRIAREMHDVLAHRISLISLHAGALELSSAGTSEEAVRSAGVVRTSAHEALEDLRDILGVLRGGSGGTGDGTGDGPGDRAGDRAGAATDRPQPTLADLPALVGESCGAGARVRLQQRLADPSAVPAVSGRTGYRVVQEGLTNARKHAPGAAVDVVVDGAPSTGLVVEVTNRCPVGGGAPSGIPGAGTGLVGLAERVGLAGGQLQHGATAEGGFRLRARLPWPR